MSKIAAAIIPVNADSHGQLLTQLVDLNEKIKQLSAELKAREDALKQKAQLVDKYAELVKGRKSDVESTSGIAKIYDTTSEKYAVESAKATRESAFEYYLSAMENGCSKDFIEKRKSEYEIAKSTYEIKAKYFAENEKKFKECQSELKKAQEEYERINKKYWELRMDWAKSSDSCTDLEITLKKYVVEKNKIEAILKKQAEKEAEEKARQAALAAEAKAKEEAAKAQLAAKQAEALAKNFLDGLDKQVLVWQDKNASSTNTLKDLKTLCDAKVISFNEEQPKIIEEIDFIQWLSKSMKAEMLPAAPGGVTAEGLNLVQAQIMEDCLLDINRLESSLRIEKEISSEYQEDYSISVTQLYTETKSDLIKIGHSHLDQWKLLHEKLNQLISSSSRNHETFNKMNNDLVVLQKNLIEMKKSLADGCAANPGSASKTAAEGTGNQSAAGSDPKTVKDDGAKDPKKDGAKDPKNGSGDTPPELVLVRADYWFDPHKAKKEQERRVREEDDKRKQQAYLDTVLEYLYKCYLEEKAKLAKEQKLRLEKARAEAEQIRKEAQEREQKRLEELRVQAEQERVLRLQQEAAAQAQRQESQVQQYRQYHYG